MKLDQFAESMWQQLDITAKTRSDYVSEYRRNLAPNIGQLQISDISKKDIVGSISRLPPQTAYKSLMVIRTLMREAIARDILEASPATQIKPPRIIVKPQKFLTWDELVELDFKAQTERIRFLALHGLRFGEAASLNMDDVSEGYVHIKRSKWGETKTPSGVRSVPQLSEYVNFPKYQDSIAKALKPHQVTVHSLRRTYAYILKKSNVHVTTAAKLMGHSNPMVTLKIYTQVLDDELDKSALDIKSYLKYN